MAALPLQPFCAGCGLDNVLLGKHIHQFQPLFSPYSACCGIQLYTGNSLIGYQQCYVRVYQQLKHQSITSVVLHNRSTFCCLLLTMSRYFRLHFSTQIHQNYLQITVLLHCQIFKSKKSEIKTLMIGQHINHLLFIYFIE